MDSSKLTLHTAAAFVQSVTFAEDPQMQQIIKVRKFADLRFAGRPTFNISVGLRVHRSLLVVRVY
jgi:hypothetical protein